MAKRIHLEIARDGQLPRSEEIQPGIYSIGSDDENTLRLDDPAVAGRHAILILRDDVAWVEDLSSPGGTLVAGRPVRGRGEVKTNEPIRIGPYSLTIRPDARPAAAAPPKPAAEEPVPATPPPAAQPPPQTPGDRKRALKQQIHRELLERLDIKRLTASQVDETDLHRRVQRTIIAIVKDREARFPPEISPKALIKEIYDEAVGLGPLEDLVADPEVTEIMVNGPGQIYVERKGRIHLTERTFMDDASVLAIVERIVSPLGRRIDESQPYVDARLKDGSRVNAIISPLSLTGPCVTIRKFSQTPFSDRDLMGFGTMSEVMARFLAACVAVRKNMVVSGGTASGKTTFLNVLSSFLPSSERIITIEDAAELRLNQIHVIRLEARPPNIEGKGAITIRDLVRNSLRMRPDRIVVGECRGGEALDMLQAMNTGHDGSLTTVHANSPRDVISRLGLMVLMSGLDLPVRAIREQITSAINVIVHLARFSDGTRKVTNIAELAGIEGDRAVTRDLFVFQQRGIGADGRILGRFTATGTEPSFLKEMESKGVKLDPAIFRPEKEAP